MPTPEEITDPLLSTYVRVPPVGPGVCDLCHSQPSSGYVRCYSCMLTTQQVSRPVELVTPISLCERNSQLHWVLRAYKDSSSPSVRQRFCIQVAALVVRFLRSHRRCIEAAAAQSWEAMVVVPSSRQRPGAHPLEQALGLVSGWDQRLLTGLIPGSGGLDHQRADDRGYAAVAQVRGRSLLLLDDTFTTGARLQSAASALQLAGARVVGAVVVGRFVNPEYCAALVKRARARPYDFGRCCLEADGG